MIGRRLTHDDQDVAEGAALAVGGLQGDLVGALVLARDLGEGDLEDAVARRVEVGPRAVRRLVLAAKCHQRRRGRLNWIGTFYLMALSSNSTKL